MVIDVVRGEIIRISYKLFTYIEDQESIHMTSRQEEYLYDFYYNEELIKTLSTYKVFFYDVHGEILSTFNNLDNPNVILFAFELHEPEFVPGPDPENYKKEWSVDVLLDDYPELTDQASSFLIQIFNEDGSIYEEESGPITVSDPTE